MICEYSTRSTVTASPGRGGKVAEGTTRLFGRRLRGAHIPGNMRFSRAGSRLRGEVQVEPSPELEALGRRRVAAFNSGDTMAQLDLYADDPHLTVIGSDPDEWWSGYATVRDILMSILPELVA